MKKKLLALGLAVMTVAMSLVGCSEKAVTWTVTCPWAPSGVAAMVSQKAASLSNTYSDKIILVADAVKGDAATVNSWVAETKANDPELVFAGEGLFSITSILDPAKMQFTYDDFEFVENLYSSVFVMSADSKLNIKNIDDLKTYMETGNQISIAANGATGSEAFLAAALFGSMGYGDQIKIVAYSSAAEAAQAVAKGETNFAVSHQSQILETYQQGGVTIVCAFDGEDIADGPFAGVEGVGKYGYPYFRNRCLILARKGTDAKKVAELKELYDKILADKSVTENTRVSYPINHIENIVRPISSAPAAKNVIFLSADAFGVLPPVSILTEAQTQYYFLSGFTAKLAGTERGITEPTPTFSACFGQAFLELHPTKYAEELVKKMEKSGAKAYLVNTGWNGTGKRISIKDTRGIIDAILNGDILNAPTKKIPFFDFEVPTELNGVDTGILDPRDTYADASEWEEKAKDLAGRFIKNFAKYEGNAAGKALVAAGPQL